MRISTIRFLFIALLISTQPARADWEADDGNALQVKAEQAIAAIRESLPGTATYFDDAYGFAIFPSVTRAGLGFGGAYGRGVVVEGDKAIGTTKFWQFTSGIQAGAKNFSMIIFFRDKEDLDYFKIGEIQFIGQAGLDFATAGVDSTPAYHEGVAIATLTRLGLMGEFTVSGARFTYKPEPEA